MASKGVTKSGEAFCMACGAGLEAGADRCESCYSRFDGEVTAFRCPRCGKVLELGTLQCPACSMKFKVKTVRPSDSAEDTRMVDRLIDWGRAGRESRRAAQAPPASVQEPLTMGEAKAVSALFREMSELADLRAEVASSMGTRISEARERVTRLVEAGPSGLMVDGIEEELGAVARDIARMDELIARTRSLAEGVDRTFAMPGPSGLAGHRDVARTLKEALPAVPRAASGDPDERELQLQQREEMVDRKIKAYALKKKELDALEAARSSGPGASQEARGRHQDQRLADKVRAIHELVSADGACDDIEPCLESLENHLKSLVESKSELEQVVAQMREGESEVRALLKVLDGMLGQLPTEVVDRFSKSEEFKLYERVLDRLNV